MPTAMHTIHFTCLQHLNKPGHYTSEHDFMTAVSTLALSCTRFYFLLWYEKFSAAAGRLPEPYWHGTPVPVFDASHDQIVLSNRLEIARKEGHAPAGGR